MSEAMDKVRRHEAERTLGWALGRVRELEAELAAAREELDALREAASAYRSLVNAYERAHVRYETANVELRQLARDAMFEANRGVVAAEARLLALLAASDAEATEEVPHG